MAKNSVLIPRPDYAVFPLSLPFFSRKEREAAAWNRLWGEYPGSLDGTTLALVPDGKKRCLAFVFEQVSEGDPLSLPTLAARKLCTTGKRYCVLAASSWIEYLVLENGTVVSTAVGGRSGEPLTEELANNAPGRFGLGEEDAEVKVFCEEAPLPENCSEGNIRYRFTPLETALAGIPRSSYSCFPEKLPGVRVRRALTAAFSVCLLLAAVFVCRLWYDGREEGRREAREAARKNAELAASREAEEKRLLGLEAEWAAVLEAEGVPVYEVLETLASALSPAVRVSQAAVKNGSFRLEGTGGSALAALERLLNHNRIDAVIETVIREKGGERFTVAGTVQRAGADGQNTAWYEAQLAAFRLREANKTGSAALAGAAVTQLLRRHGAAPERLRFLPAEGGWTIECSAAASPAALAGMVEDASSPGQPWRVTGLETRNLGGNVDAVMTFFVRGPSGARTDGGYEEHPGASRIAALYGRPGGRPVPVAAVPHQIVSLPAAEKPAAVPPRQGVLEYVGAVGTDDGQKHIYVRDTAGNLVRLTEGGITSGYVTSGGTVTALIDGIAYEVRRNDGF